MINIPARAKKTGRAEFCLREGILGGIHHALGLVEGNLLNAQQLHDGKQRLAGLAERHRAMMREAALDQDMTIEAVHLGDAEYADAAEGAGVNGQNLALRDVADQLAVLIALQAASCKTSDIGFPYRNKTILPSYQQILYQIKRHTYT